MWPKAFGQLVELVPHITRLIPIADRFLNSKTASEEASHSAMQEMAEGLRGDLGQVTAAHSGLYQKLNEQNEKLSGVAAGIHTCSLSITLIDERLTRLERQSSRLFLFLGIVLLILIALFVVSIFILARLR